MCIIRTDMCDCRLQDILEKNIILSYLQIYIKVCIHSRILTLRKKGTKYDKTMNTALHIILP